MRKFFKIISLILLVSLFVSCLPIYAFAEDSNQTDTTSAVNEESKEQGNQSLNNDLTDNQTSLNSSNQVSKEQKTDATNIIGEETDKRSKNVKHFKKSDGSFVAYVYPTAVHYKDGNQWKDIDNTLSEQLDEDNNDVLENNSNDFKIKIAKNAKHKKLVSIKKGNYEITWNIGNSLNNKTDKYLNNSNAIYNDTSSYQEQTLTNNEKNKVLTKLNSTVNFTDVYPNVDLQYVVQPEKLKENIILKNRISDPEFTFNLNTKNLSIKILDDNSLSFYNEQDPSKEIFKIDAPYMKDANGEISKDIKIILSNTSNGYKVSLQPSVEWLNNTDRVYPVIIDPTVKTIDLTFAVNVSQTGKGITPEFIKIGNDPTSGITRAYFYPAGLDSLNEKDIITSAYLDLSQQSRTSTILNINAYKITSSWSTIGWSTQPSVDTSRILDYEESGNRWDITPVFQDWNYNKNVYGVLLKDPKDTYYHGNLATIYAQYYYMIDGISNEPYYEINYISNSGNEDYWTTHSISLNRSGTAYVNDFSGNLIYSHDDLVMNGNRMPINLKHIYNASSKGQDIGLGLGWRLSYNQTIKQPTTNGNVYYPYPGYIYTDNDGTEHYFDDSNSDGIYEDEDGLNLKMTINVDKSYTITDKLNNKINFNSSGNMTSVVDSNGNTITMNYTGALITSITDGAGRVTILNYDLNNHLSSIKDPSNRITSYEYTGNLLTKINYPDQKYTTFSYTSNVITTIGGIDNRNIIISYYDPTGTSSKAYKVNQLKMSNIDGTLGSEYNFEYSNNSTTVTDEIGRKTIYEFNGNGNTINIIYPDKSAQYYKYSAKNKLTLVSKPQSTIINYIKSHDENYAGFWTGGGSTDSQGSCSIATEDKYLGSQSLKISKTNNVGYHSYGTSANIPGDGTYTLSCYIKTVGITNTNNKGVYLQIVDSFGTKTSSYINGTNDWQRISFTFDESAVTRVSIYLGIEGETGTAYFDSMQLERGSVANRYNLLENADFSDGLTNFTKSSGCTSSDTVITTTDSTQPSILSAGRFTVSGTANTTKEISQTVNISGKANDTFVISGWANGCSLPGGTFGLRLGIKATSGYTYDTYIPFDYSNTNWQYLCDRVTASVDYMSVTITACYNNNANTAYFDGLQLYREGYGDSYQYDSNGNVTNLTDVANGQVNLQYTNNDITNISDENTHSTGYTYDSNHNLLTSTSAEGVITTNTYDRYGNPLTSTKGSSTIIKTINTYTADGNYLNTSTNELGNIVTYNYNLSKGTLDRLVDAAGKTTTYTYDPNSDMLTDVTKTVDGSQINNHYEYSNDYLSKITHNGFDYSFNYDSLGNLTNSLVGSQSLVQNTYEPRTSRLTDSTYGNGQKVSYTYDNMDRVTALKYNDNVRTTYEYGSYGNLGYKNDLVNGVNYKYLYDIKDQLTKIIDSFGNITSYNYDANGNNTQLYEKVNGSEFTTNYAYNKDNNQSLVTLNGGKTISYNYNTSTESLSSSVINTGTAQYTTSYTYYPNVNPTNGVTTLVQTMTNGSNGAISYTYDSKGNIETITNGGQVIKYYYNELNEVTREDNQVLNKTITQSYDAGGNITTKNEYAYTTGTLGTPTKTYSYTYDSTWKDKLMSYDGKSITYDPIGNPLTYNGWTYTWEMGRQLSTAANAGTSISYKYNDDGVRTQKIVNGVTTNYHIVGNKVTFESNGTDNIYYSYDSNDKLVSMSLNGVIYYYIYNAQGDIIGLFDSSGTQVVAYTYDTWGKLISTTGTLASTVGAKNPYRYRGYRYDTETGLYYLQSRYYNPEWGRFINADKLENGEIGKLLTYNLYAYCLNEPIMHADPNGFSLNFSRGSTMSGYGSKDLNAKQCNTLAWFYGKVAAAASFVGAVTPGIASKVAYALGAYAASQAADLAYGASTGKGVKVISHGSINTYIPKK